MPGCFKLPQRKGKRLLCYAEEKGDREKGGGEEVAEMRKRAKCFFMTLVVRLLSAPTPTNLLDLSPIIF